MVSGQIGGTQRGQKLELTWVGKEDRPRLEPRILIEDPALSYAASSRTEGDLFDNRLIQGDNLLALKALETEYAGRIKCIYIDPPYNTGAAFEHYNDGLEHSLWLTMMRDRLEILKLLLSEDGSIWINIDDNEAHYLKVLCDEVFHRRNFIANIVWQKRTSRENRAAIGSSHDHILVYAKCTAQEWKQHRNKLPPSGAGFSNPDNDIRGLWRSIPFTAQGFRANQMYPITTPSGKVLEPPKGRCWGATEPVFKKLLAESRIYFPKGGESRPRVKQFMGEEDGLVPSTWWTAADYGDNENAKKEILAVFSDKEPFCTPKPEKLIGGIIQIATRPGDIVLDSFAGSGTTGAVAHKMGRRWIMVELGNHAITHIAPRLQKVINGDDAGGITNEVGWTGGGGYRFDRLAPSLLVKDRWDNWVISKDYNPAMLAEAMCKHMGFTYGPSQDPIEYWRHGHSSERDFLFVTTYALTPDMLVALSYDVGPDRHLLICCKAFNSKQASKFENLTLVRIPQAILSTCEWARDDYSLRIANITNVTSESAETGSQPTLKPQIATKARAVVSPTLFDLADSEA